MKTNILLYCLAYQLLSLTLPKEDSDQVSTHTYTRPLSLSPHSSLGLLLVTVIVVVVASGSFYFFTLFKLRRKRSQRGPSTTPDQHNNGGKDPL